MKRLKLPKNKHKGLYVFCTKCKKHFITTNEGVYYSTISVPTSFTPIDIQISIPIYTDKLIRKTHLDGFTYSFELMMIDMPYLMSFELEKNTLHVENKFTGIGPMYYDKERGYIDFQVTASTFRGTTWIGSRIEVHMPKNQEITDFYGLNEPIYYDKL